MVLQEAIDYQNDSRREGFPGEIPAFYAQPGYETLLMPLDYAGTADEAAVQPLPFFIFGEDDDDDDDVDEEGDFDDVEEDFDDDDEFEDDDFDDDDDDDYDEDEDDDYDYEEDVDYDEFDE
jgi:hypothetical protein